MKITLVPGPWLPLAMVCVSVGSPLQALAQDSATTLSKVTIVGDRTLGYQAGDSQLGPLAAKPLLDTPYSLDVVPANLIANQQLKSVREVFRYLPSVQGENIRPQTRGLQAGVVQNTRIDGMNMASTTDYPVEQFDRIEVLNGLAGALYGPANPAGTFNYVLKRPTAEPLRSVSVGYSTRAAKLFSVDVGDTLGQNKLFGYRVNLLSDRGEGYVDRSFLERQLASLAFDINFTDATRLELNASRYHYIDDGFPGTFALAKGIRFPEAPDPTRVGLGQPFAGDDNVTKTFSGRLKHDFNADWHVAAGLLQQDSDRASTVPTNTLTGPATGPANAYTTTAATTTFSLDRIVSNTVALNGRVVTGAVSHDLVVSNTGFNWTRYQPYVTRPITLGTATLANPVVFAEPVFPDFKSRFKALNTQQQSVTVGDTLGFDERWSAGLFASQSWIKVANYDKSGATLSRYDDSGVSANATLSYKPAKNMSVYGSYADNLQQGDIAPAGPLNAGVGLAPYRSKQWELGYKVDVGQMLLAADVFRVERPYAVTGADNIFRVQGEQVNEGVELTATGSVTDALTIYGGITYLDPKVNDTGDPTTAGKQILGLSKWVGSVLLDYRIPALTGLAVNLHVMHASTRYGDNIDSYQVAGFTTTDIGARYVCKLWGTVANWNLALDNVTDARYWANITPTGQNGYTGIGNGTGTLGAPRLLRASLQVEF